jgi:acetylxylan esterase
MRSTALFLGWAALSQAYAVDKRQSSCPNVHVIAARETTAPAGYGTASVVTNLILNAYSGSTSEALNYPACGGQSSCGGDSYDASVRAGYSAATSAINSFNSQCPNSQIVLVGYSQVGHMCWLVRAATNSE